MHQYVRIGCAVPSVQIGNPEGNAEKICEMITRAENANCDLIVFPELCLTGYTCGDLFFQDLLLKRANSGLKKIVQWSESYPHLTILIGLPIMAGGLLCNCAAVVSAGKLQGLVPKTYIPNSNEFYEQRWFSSADDLTISTVLPSSLGLDGIEEIPIGTDLVFSIGDDAKIGIEICEDLWTPIPPSSFLALNGAEILVNLSASNETVGKRQYRKEIAKHQSSATYSIYTYCSAGSDESTQDLIFSGHSMIYENGVLLQENGSQISTDYLMVQDADLGKVRADRKKNKSYSKAIASFGTPVRVINCNSGELRSQGEMYPVSKLPFVPSAKTDRRQRCLEIFRMQASGLARRLKAIKTNAVIGVSGGLDSTLALLVSVEAMRMLGRPASDVYGVTMPCFGTSDRTYTNSLELMRSLGIHSKEINIRDAVNIHFRDIEHDPQILNATYENSQARERTQILMDYASVVGGIVIGTGDLSELALGWCTYNGDHMSMYGVNASIPKTLIRWMIEAIAEMPEFCASKAVLEDILDTPISPELLPPDAEGKISQHTEDLVGPYALHDFFLFYVMRYGFEPKKIYELACRAFRDDFDRETILKWMKNFYRRFFSQQFKRSCMPDGVKVGSVSLSPRGDWRMPSDAVSTAWLQELEEM